MYLIVIILEIELTFNQVMTQKLSFKSYWIFFTLPLMKIKLVLKMVLIVIILEIEQKFNQVMT